MATKKLDLVNATIKDLAARIQKREVSPVEITKAAIDRTERLQPILTSYTTFTPEYALMRAKEAERDIVQGRYRGPFHGIPYSLKDVIATKGIKTTFGNPKEVDYKPKESATIFRLLEEAGGILMGKVVSEIGRDNAGPVGARNAWDPTRSPGTSSSGSGSAVASSQCLGSIGTDTGGSVRHPGSNSNLVAMRPTHGRISGFGVTGAPLTTDQAGPLTKTVEDNAIMMNILGRYDPKDLISINEPPYDHLAGIREGIKGLRIGVPVDDWVWKDLLTEEEEEVCRTALTIFGELGANVTEIKLPRAGEATRTSRFIPGAAPRSPGARGLFYKDNFTKEQLDAWPEVNGANVEQELQSPIEPYFRSQLIRLGVKQEAEEVLREVDIIAMPTGSTYGDAWDAKSTTVRGKTMQARSRATYRNTLASSCGHPSVSVPCGFGHNDQWPIGLMLQGMPLTEAMLYRACYAYEQATEWHKRHPKL